VSWWRGAGIKCAVHMQPIASEAVEPVRFSIILDQLLDVSRPAVSASEPGFAHPCHGGAGVAVEHSGTAQPITKKVLKSKERVPGGAQLILGGFMACMYYPMAQVDEPLEVRTDHTAPVGIPIAVESFREERPSLRSNSAAAS